MEIDTQQLFFHTQYKTQSSNVYVTGLVQLLSMLQSKLGFVSQS
jgi:hypothetical protein